MTVLTADRPQVEAAPPAPRAPRVAYMMSRFPKLTETFILYEMLAVQAQGVTVELFPLQRERTTVMHPEAAPLVARAHYQPLLSGAILRAQWHYLRRKPRAYLGALRDLLRANWGSARYFVGALAFFPKAVRFAQLMEAAGIDHLHAHFASHPAAMAFVIHRLTGIPYSFTAHGSDLHRDKHMLCQKVAEAAFVVTIARFNQEIFVAECGASARDKVRVIHCGVDTEAFQPRRAQPDLAGPLQILCIGTLHEVKGQTHLIEACRLLRERGVEFVCRFVGDGPDEPMLRAQVAQAGLADAVHFEGRKTRQEVIALLNAADVVVAPSVPSRDKRREGIPVVLMEAMGAGVPVIASDLSGIPELVEHEVSGLLVPPGDAAAIASALERLAADPALRARLGQGGRDKVLREFDLATNAARLVELFSGSVQP
jgi:glycosyltransferase involved in cell wall biosynthesis